MVDLLIRGKIIEIMVIVTLVVTTIPVWYLFEQKYSEANVMTVEEANQILNYYSSNS